MHIRLSLGKMQNKNERGANSHQLAGREGLFSGTVCIGRPPRYERAFFRKNVSLKLCREGLRESCWGVVAKGRTERI